MNNLDSFWKDKKVFVTGANGFLGSHLTKALVEKGAGVFTLIYEDNPGLIFDEENLSAKTRTIRGDVRDLNLIEKILNENEIDTIFHLAAQAIVDHAVDDPLETFEVNIQGTWNILEAAKKFGKIERVIIASSDKAYGHHDFLPYRENTHPLKGIYPYEVSKSCADLIGQSYHRTFGLPVCITRCTNLYGPGDSKMNRIVPNTIKCFHYNEPPIIRDTSESLRDYLFVEDAVDGYLKLAEKMSEGIHGHAFNLSVNTPLSILEVITAIAREMNKQIEPKIIKTKGFEILNQYASYEKARNVLGWKPKHSFLEGIKKTIPWYINYLENSGKGE
ncbi:NAD-dependent epimerase/dehydratase family protein [bacterium]|nr:MAG: NAD-dependent epimerase/dehydratase family protein [bacterium]